MAALSDYAEKAILDWIMGGATPTRPSARYVALFTAAPNDAGGGTEVSTGSYARQAATWDAATSGTGVTANADAQSFTASGASWGSITHVAVFDAATTGNLLWHGAITTARTVNDGDTITFAIGAIDLTMA